MAMNTTCEIEQSWLAIEITSRTMREAAKTEDWSQVLELASARHLNVLSHFQCFPVGPANADFYRHQLMVMLDGEKELQALTLLARKRVMQESSIVNHNHRAVGAYLAQ